MEAPDMTLQEEEKSCSDMIVKVDKIPTESW